MLRQDIFSRDNTLWAQGLSILGIMLMHYVMQLDSYPRVLNIIGSIGPVIAAFSVSSISTRGTFAINVLTRPIPT